MPKFWKSSKLSINFDETEALKEKRNATIAQETKLASKKTGSNFQGPTTGSAIQAAVTEFDSSVDSICTTFMELVGFAEKLISTKCENLKSYILNLVSYWSEKTMQILKK